MSRILQKQYENYVSKLEFPLNAYEHYYLIDKDNPKTYSHYIATDDGKRAFIVGKTTSSLDWASITGTPTTVAGYGITDVYTKSESDLRYYPISSNPAGYLTSVDWSSISSKPNSGNFIYNQNATNQSANFWIDGILKNEGVSYLSSITGLVGVGTTSPASYLAGINGVAVYNSSFSGISLATSTHYHILYTGEITGDFEIYQYGVGTVLRIFNGGSVGVNTSTNNGYNFDVNGTGRFTGVFQLDTIANASTNPNKFLVSDGGVIKYRTASQLFSDGLAQPNTQILYGTGTGVTSSAQLTYAYNLFGDGYWNVLNYIPSGNPHFTAKTSAGLLDFAFNYSSSVGVISASANNGIQFSAITTGSGNAPFYWTSGGSQTEYMRLQGDGKLLVGFTTSQGTYNLQVNGALYVNSGINSSVFINTNASYTSIITHFSDGLNTKSTLAIFNVVNWNFYSSLTGTMKGYSIGTAIMSSSGNIGNYLGGTYLASFFFDTQTTALNNRGVILFDGTNVIQTWYKDGTIGVSGKFLVGYTSSQGAYQLQVSSGIYIGASTTSAAQIRLINGIDPTTPNNGDIWFDGTDIKMRIGGVTKIFTLT